MGFLRFIFQKLMNIYFPNDLYSIRKIRKFGKSLLIYANEHSGRKIYLGIFENKETNFLLNEIKPDDVCLDIGANIGYFTLLFSSKAKEVVAVEPIRQNADLIRLTSSINKDKNVKVYCVAVSNEAGEKTFVESSHSSLSGIGSNDFRAELKSHYGASALDSYQVSTVTIDSLELKKLDIVKMDIEGHEFNALQGMTKTLSSLRPRLLMIELVESHLNRFGVNLKAVVGLMKEQGYTAKILKNNKLEEYVEQAIPNDNLFFTPN